MCIYEEPVYLTSAYTRRVKEPIHTRLHPNNINRDSEIDIPEAWNKTVFKKIEKNFCSGTFNERTLTGNRVQEPITCRVP